MRPIDADALLDGIPNLYERREVSRWVDEAPTINTVSVVRCGECKHRPTGNRTEGLNFPDYKCPCRCEDEWYSWKPDSNWFCANGEK